MLIIQEDHILEINYVHEEYDSVSSYNYMCLLVKDYVRYLAEKFESETSGLLSSLKETINLSEKFHFTIVILCPAAHSGLRFMHDFARMLLRRFNNSAGFMLGYAFWLWQNRPSHRHLVVILVSYNVSDVLILRPSECLLFLDAIHRLRRAYLLKHQRLGDDSNDIDSNLALTR